MHYLLFLSLPAAGAKQQNCLGITWPPNRGMLQSFCGVFVPKGEPRGLSQPNGDYLPHLTFEVVDQ